MSVDKYQDHIMILPEDDAYSALVNGFLLAIPENRLRRIQPLAVAKGWIKVLEQFELDHVGGMNRYKGRHMILLIDFDGKEDRLARAKNSVPASLISRVFVLGVWSEPERLTDLPSYEQIGAALANECRAGTGETWGHKLLRHNAGEIDRMRERVWPILFE